MWVKVILCNFLNFLNFFGSNAIIFVMVSDSAVLRNESKFKREEIKVD